METPGFNRATVESQFMLIVFQVRAGHRHGVHRQGHKGIRFIAVEQTAEPLFRDADDDERIVFTASFRPITRTSPAKRRCQ